MCRSAARRTKTSISLRIATTASTVARLGAGQGDLSTICAGVRGRENCRTVLPGSGVCAILQERMCGDRKLSNRLTSASAPNTNKTYGENPLLRYVLHAIHSRQCGSLHQRRKHGAPRCLRAQRSTVDHRGARPLAPHARPPWHSESVWKHKI